MRTLLLRGAIFLSFSCVFIGTAHASPAKSETRFLFEEANNAYRNGEYTKAIVGYEQALQADFASGNIYYNLGNAYVKNGQLARALLNYERARCLMPGDSDLRANYDYVRQSLSSAQGFYSGALMRRVDALFSSVSMNALVLFSSCAYFVLLVCVFLHLCVPAAKRISRILILLILMSVGTVALPLWQKINMMRYGALIVSEEAPVLFAPVASSTVFFTLKQGAACFKVESVPGWYKVRRVDGKSGWVKQEAVGLLAGV